MTVEAAPRTPGTLITDLCPRAKTAVALLTNPYGFSMGLLAVATTKFRGCPDIITLLCFEARCVLVPAAADLMEVRCKRNIIVTLKATITLPANHIVLRYRGRSDRRRSGTMRSFSRSDAR